MVEISEAVGKNVGVSVARGDGPSSKVVKEVMKREGWFCKKEKNKKPIGKLSSDRFFIIFCC